MSVIFRNGMLSIFGVILTVWLLSGIYIVDDSENAVVLRFGEHVKTVTDSGMKYHLPLPIEKVWKENVSEPKRLEYGYRTLSEKDSNNKAKYEAVLEESTMLTGDENLLHVETSMQFVITDVEDFMFNVADPYQTLRMAGESAIRRVVANHSLDDVLTDNKLEVQQEIQVQLQNMANSYGLGVQIRNVQLQDVDPPSEVDAAFKDVAAAKEDKTSAINEAEIYKNEVIPKARGNAEEILNKAEAYKQKRTAEARGDVAKFNGILEEYKEAKEVTRTRMYLETMEQILPDIEKYIVDEQGNTVQFLPLGGLTQSTEKN